MQNFYKHVHTVEPVVKDQSLEIKKNVFGDRCSLDIGHLVDYNNDLCQKVLYLYMYNETGLSVLETIHWVRI
jgi:hypothetical protein